MKEQLKEAIMQTIASWDEPDIYVVSLYVYPTQNKTDSVRIAKSVRCLI